MQRLVWKDLDEEARARALARPPARASDELVGAARAIVDDVRSGGWDALVEQSERIDGVAPRLIEVGPLAAEARRTLGEAELGAIELARDNVASFHQAMVPV